MKLIYSSDEILADAPYERTNLYGTQRLHGGFDTTGTYISPRTLGRWPAIRAWRDHLLAAGGELIDASMQVLRAPHYPSTAQMKLLLQNDITLPLWSSLTTIGIIEGRGRMLTTVTAPDFQSMIMEDIAGTATAHLNKGLLLAHGLDEGGDGTGRIGAHDAMWFLVRDLALGEDLHPSPELAARDVRPGSDLREMPALSPEAEGLIKLLMNVLMVEIRAERGFAFNLALLQDPELFTGRRDQAALAATIVSQIQQDEAPHVAYLQLVISEMRRFQFKTAHGCITGRTFIDPVWAKVSAWHANQVPLIQRDAARELVKLCLAHRKDGKALMERFDQLEDGNQHAVN
jgi:hypothetical protein